VKPPSTIVVPEMVVRIGLIHSNGEFLVTGCMGLFHGAYFGWYALCSNSQKSKYSNRAQISVFW